MSAMSTSVETLVGDEVYQNTSWSSNLMSGIRPGKSGGPADR